MPKSKRDVPTADGPPRKKTRVMKVPDKTGFKQHDRKHIEKLRSLFEPKAKAKKKQYESKEDARAYHKLSAREVKKMVEMRF
jgi:cysteine synthase